MSVKPVTFRDWEAELMQEPGAQELADEFEPGFQIAVLRHLRGLTQKELAERVGTTQSSIARLEIGDSQPNLSFLRRVAAALDAQVVVRIEAKEPASVPLEQSVPEPVRAA